MARSASLCRGETVMVSLWSGERVVRHVMHRFFWLIPMSNSVYSTLHDLIRTTYCAYLFF